MIVREAHRTRHLVIRLDRGDELPGALIRALDEAEARSGFVTGTGTLEAAVLRHSDQTTYRLDAPADVVSLTGTVSVSAGATSLQLSAALSRATEIGLSTFGGHLTWARARSVEIHAVIFEDLALARVEDPETGLPVLEARPAVTSILARPAPVTSTAAHAEAPRPPAQAVVAEPPPPSPRAPAPPVTSAPAVRAPAVEPPRAPPPAPPPAPAPAHTPSLTSPNEVVALPQKPQKPKEDLDAYPEVGDTVMHFHFGECTVIGSDGDRIRLRQDRDGRVREVALTMLRIEMSTEETGGPDAPRHFKLHRKN